MREEGVNYTCDRCGQTEFTTVNTAFMPCGWMNQDGKHLCPTCTDAYNTMMNNFYAPVVKRPLELEGELKGEVKNGKR